MAEKTFHIGLCMAGAISAGAYSAGVMDFLLEALHEWEKLRGKLGVPSHRVIISVIGGASAGGMTGIVAGSAINQPLKTVEIPSTEDLLKVHPENKYYHSWVDLLGDDMFRLMLDHKDIENSKRVESLMNSSFIDDVAQKIIKINTAEWIETPAYIANQLKLFTTLTNLEGLKYNISFNSEIMQNRYNMSVHNDYACFNLNTTKYNNDGWMPLCFKTGTNTSVAQDAAMATGAFPIGLKSRILKRTKETITQNPWLNQTKSTDHLNDKNPVFTQNVDGGLINNEPFEKVKQLLSEITKQTLIEDQNSFNLFKSAVLMIDPFPSELPSAFNINQQLFPTIGYTLNAMTQQMRAKPAPLIDAMSPFKSGQFLIAPIRPALSGDDIGKKIEGSKAIACGAFDGFSGFMNKEFRIHDYYLGRYNCEMFLRNYFTIPAANLKKNPIFSDGYEGIDINKFKSFHDDSYQIIPIFKPIEAGYYPMPIFSSGNHWPTIAAEKLNNYESAIKKRIELLLIYAFPISGFWRVIVMIVAKFFLNKKIAKYMIGVIKNMLEKHELIKKEGT